MTTVVSSATDPSPMSEEEYKVSMDLLTNAARTIGMLPLAKMDTLLSRAEALAPMLDPTAWMKQGHNIEDARALVRGAHAFMREVAAIKDRARKRGEIP